MSVDTYQLIRDAVGDIIDESEAAIYGDSHARLLDAVHGHVERLLRDMWEGTS